MHIVISRKNFSGHQDRPLKGADNLSRNQNYEKEQLREQGRIMQAEGESLCKGPEVERACVLTAPPLEGEGAGGEVQ